MCCIDYRGTQFDVHEERPHVFGVHWREGYNPNLGWLRGAKNKCQRDIIYLIYVNFK